MNPSVSTQVTPLAELSAQLAAHAANYSKPLSPAAHLIKGSQHAQLLLVNGSRLYPLSKEQEQRLGRLLSNRDEAGLQQELIALGLDAPMTINDQPLQSPPLYALSLAIAQKCNLGCTYCYADQGDFGGPAKSMSLETAQQAIDMLIKDCPAGGKIQLSFLGGEPLSNRKGLVAATEYAWQQARPKNIRVGFSVTTNGTLLTREDADFFEKYGFAVTISLDGAREQHDLLRPMKNGKGSYDRIIKNIQPLLQQQRQMQVAARITVTPVNNRLPDILNEFIEMGFHSVGFSPLLRSSNGKGEMSREDLELMLEGMIECGLHFEKNMLQGRRYPFLNMVNALKELHKGTHRPYPCGAGAGYLGVSADGELAACHRFVNEPEGNMGNIFSGIDANLQNDWLANRHVHTQEPCRQCWARYMCGGGCHHEVLAKGRHACDYIRGWLYYTMQAYDRMLRMVPEWFSN